MKSWFTRVPRAWRLASEPIWAQAVRNRVKRC
jgi:hypothetical protein